MAAPDLTLTRAELEKPESRVYVLDAPPAADARGDLLKANRRPARPTAEVVTHPRFQTAQARRHMEQKAAEKREKHRALIAHHSRLREARKLQRTPSWADHAAIRAVYERAVAIERETGVPQHVDHFYPLNGKLVSGLHVETNLQVIPAIDNIRKSNRYEP